MRNTGLLVDERFRRHRTGAHHPESPERLEVLENLFAADRYRDFPRIDARPAGEEELRRVHEHDHVAAVAASAHRPHTQFDADTPASTESFEAARLAAGGSIAMAEAICSGEIDNGFAALRPPGHHAEGWRPMGFCLFNNVAVVARHLRQARGLDRILIVDWDVHHGNGTQNTFYDDTSVMYVSTHQYPFYPGTGSAAEVGAGSAAGYNINVPMAAGSTDAHYFAAFRDLIVPVARRFRPQFVLVSAGFDAHRDDPLASVMLSTAAFGALTDALVEVADEHARGRILLLLEGGYDLDALAASVQQSVERLREPRPFRPTEGELSGWARQAAEAAAAYWDMA